MTCCLRGELYKKRIPTSHPADGSAHLAHSFTNLMFQGKTKSAIRLLTEGSKGGVLHLNDKVDGQRTVREILVDKHPAGQPTHPEALIEDEPAEVHLALFEAIDASMIRSTALRVSGAAGPSGIDALGWRRLCTSFKSASFDLCHSLALTAKRLCTSYVDPSTTAPFLACRLIVLDKNPGVRPIGIGDTARRIVARAILTITI